MRTDDIPECGCVWCRAVRASRPPKEQTKPRPTRIDFTVRLPRDLEPDKPVRDVVAKATEALASFTSRVDGPESVGREGTVVCDETGVRITWKAGVESDFQQVGMEAGLEQQSDHQKGEAALDALIARVGFRRNDVVGGSMLAEFERMLADGLAKIGKRPVRTREQILAAMLNAPDGQGVEITMDELAILRGGR